MSLKQNPDTAAVAEMSRWDKKWTFIYPDPANEEHAFTGMCINSTSHQAQI
jgi:hypothetical protein